jgi:alkanesulfonate monooxygenase SsuD/methylene tetrahydromethanopterin reductase-like flavin-dependent oxidoreductase (luciferase family)
MLRLTAEHADLWNGYLESQRNDPALVVPFREALDAACMAVGRDPATLVRTVGVRVDQSSEGMPWPWPPAITGTPEAIAETLRAFAREGIAHLQVSLTPPTLAAVEVFAPVLERLDRG